MSNPNIDALNKDSVGRFLDSVRLTTREKVCVRLRARGMTHREMGSILGLCASRAGQILKRAETKAARQLGAKL